MLKNRIFIIKYDYISIRKFSINYVYIASFNKNTWQHRRKEIDPPNSKTLYISYHCNHRH